jgi:hypothetical protein
MVERGSRREVQGVMEDIWVVFIDRLAVRDASTRVTMWMWSTSVRNEKESNPRIRNTCII